MDGNSVCEQAFDAWLHALRLFVVGQGGNFRSLGDRHFELFTGARIADLNGYVIQKPKPDISLIASALPSFAPPDMPWGITARGRDAASLLSEIAVKHRLTNKKCRPLMSADLKQYGTPVRFDGLFKLRVLEAADQDRYIDALSAGFEAPREIVSVLGRVFHLPGSTAYAIEDNGRFVSTGLTVRHDEWAVVFNVSTDPSYRRQGLARKLINAMLSDARLGGARHALLQSAEAAVPLYETTGFSRTENLLTLASAN